MCLCSVDGRVYKIFVIVLDLGQVFGHVHIVVVEVHLDSWTFVFGSANIMS